MRPADPVRVTASSPSTGSRTRAPNRALRALLEESEWTQAAFARALARLGAEVGIHLRYDRTSVAHWLRGSRPDPRVQHLMAEALSRAPRPPDHGGGPGHARRPRLPPRHGGPPARRQRWRWRWRRGRHLRPGGGRTTPHRGGRTGRAPEAAPGAARLRCSGGRRRGTGRGPRTPGGRPSLFGLGRPLRPVDQLTALTAPVIPPPRADTPPPAPYTLGLLTETVRGRRDGRPDGAPAEAGGDPAADDPATAPGAPTPAPLPGARNGCTARGSRPARTPEPGQVASVHEHARFFALQADRYGGGHIRTPLAACLSGLVRSLRHGEEGVHRRGIQAGAARLSFLLARVLRGRAAARDSPSAPFSPRRNSPRRPPIRRGSRWPAAPSARRRTSWATRARACCCSPGRPWPRPRRTPTPRRARSCTPDWPWRTRRAARRAGRWRRWSARSGNWPGPRSI